MKVEFNARLFAESIVVLVPIWIIALWLFSIQVSLLEFFGFFGCSVVIYYLVASLLDKNYSDVRKSQKAETPEKDPRGREDGEGK